MTQDQANYLSYLLRLWRDSDTENVWRVSLESARTGERWVSPVWMSCSGSCESRPISRQLKSKGGEGMHDVDLVLPRATVTRAAAIERKHRPNDHRKESNMKRGRWILLALLVVFAFPVALYAKDPNPAGGTRATVTEFTGTENLEDLVYEGDFTWTPGGAWRVRDRKWAAVHDTTDPRVTGDAIIVVNCNVSPHDTGHCWGTMHVDPDDFEGAWEATWHSPEGRPEITAVGYGTGELKGLKAWWTFRYYEGDPVGYISGRIRDPHGE